MAEGEQDIHDDLVREEDAPARMEDAPARMEEQGRVPVVQERVEDDSSSESEGSGGWTSEELEDEDQFQQFNEDEENRRALFEERLADGNWCRCGHCVPIGFAESLDDLTCCREGHHVQIGEVRAEQYRGGAVEIACVTQHPAFHPLCIYRRQVENVYHIYRVRGFDDRVGDINRRLRYSAYKSFTTWIYGKLGRFVRKEIPMCVTKAVREAFPDPDDDYRGFRPVNFEDLNA